MFYKNFYNTIFLVVVGMLFTTSCNKLLPKDRDAITDDSQFTQTVYQPILGRTTVMDKNFYSGNSSLPFTFKIINPRLYTDGSPAQELLDTFPVTVWKKQYTGNETSLAEIENERAIEYHPLFEIGGHSGVFTMWASAQTPFVRSLPDSGYVFDVEASNSGGRVYFRNFRLMPLKEQPYEPSNINQNTGQSTAANVYPSSVTNVYGERDNTHMMSPADVYVYFYKSGDGNSLTFKFMDTLFHPINPLKFADTDWKNLVHGFNMQMTPDSVKYDVAYPIPLVTIPTKYTTPNGNQARVQFKYHRIGFGGFRQDAIVSLDFNIYEKGDWQIVFWFKGDNPKFNDD
ncbi:DUF5007 domain-containing protein [Arachidicoccus sp.]|uniref:DUF5007 domain-containing protein n=1 Tax=Arachidicoccus sp. TaxID=1872624 RepID=UPI003D2125C3